MQESASSLEESLLKLERRFWEVRPERIAQLYREALVNEALLVLPEPAGLLDKADCIAAFDGLESVWTDYSIEDTRLVQLTSESAVLTYLAAASREDDVEPYVAFVSSVYVLRQGVWLLAFHQQTPRQEPPVFARQE